MTPRECPSRHGTAPGPGPAPANACYARHTCYAPRGTLAAHEAPRVPLAAWGIGASDSDGSGAAPANARYAPRGTFGAHDASRVPLAAWGRAGGAG